MAVYTAHRLFLGLAAGLALSSAALAGDFSDSSTYNAPAGMSSASGNAASNYSIRDENGNLTIINGMFASATTSQTSGVQSASASASGAGSSQSGTGTGSSSGTSGAGNMFGGASAIGNQLNVVTVGNYNTVIVNSTQTNNGNQTASVVLNKDSGK